MSDRNNFDPEYIAGLTPCHSTNLRWVTRDIDKLYRSFMRTDDNLGTQFTVLAYLDNNGPLDIQQMGERMHLERTSLVRKLASMSKQGLIEKIKADPARSKPYKITKKGEKALDECIPKWEQAQKTVRDQFTDAEWAVFTHCLEKLSSIENSE